MALGFLARARSNLGVEFRSSPLDDPTLIVAHWLQRLEPALPEVFIGELLAVTFDSRGAPMVPNVSTLDEDGFG